MNRATDINDFYKDNTIQGLIATSGGWNAGEVLEHLDFTAIENNQKPIIGFSDISVLQNGIFAKTGCQHLHAPLLCVGLTAPDKVTTTSLQKALSKEPQEFPISEFGNVLQPGEAEGTILGGNIITLETLLGTSYEPNWEGAVIFIEEVGEKLFRLLRALNHFKMAGVWNKASAIVIGTMEDCDGTFEGTEQDIFEAISSFFSFFKGPILRTELFGHHIVGGEGSHISIPIGGIAKIDTSNGITLSFS